MLLLEGDEGYENRVLQVYELRYYPIQPKGIKDDFPRGWFFKQNLKNNGK